MYDQMRPWPTICASKLSMNAESSTTSFSCRILFSRKLLCKSLKPLPRAFTKAFLKNSRSSSVSDSLRHSMLISLTVSWKPILRKKVQQPSKCCCSSCLRSSSGRYCSTSTLSFSSFSQIYFTCWQTSYSGSVSSTESARGTKVASSASDRAMSIRISTFSLSLMSLDSEDHLRKLSSLRRWSFLLLWLSLMRLQAMFALCLSNFLVTLSVKNVSSFTSRLYRILLSKIMHYLTGQDLFITPKSVSNSLRTATEISLILGWK